MRLMANLLVLYNYGHYAGYPPRATVRDHLYAFARYAGHPCGYLNLAVRTIPDYVAKAHWDLIIFHTPFLVTRWKPVDFQRLLDKVQCFRESTAVKVMLPQDEFIHTDLLGEFISDFRINHVFSVAPPSTWPKIYPSLPASTTISQVLTGYLDDRVVAWLDRQYARQQTRPIDIGYRSAHPMMWLGRQGQLKWQVGEVVQQHAAPLDLVTDISTRPQDTILGDAWYEFLLRCKYFLGVEGGASILDRDGAFWARTNAYLAQHPLAQFSEVETACFPGVDGSFDLRAISPRHLEACATRTCQVLIEGDYNGILQPGIHYLMVKRDFSNVDDVLRQVKDDTQRETIVARAFQDVVASEQYTYRAFVRQVIMTALGQQTNEQRHAASSAITWRMRQEDRVAWGIVATLAKAKRLVKGRPAQ